MLLLIYRLFVRPIARNKHLLPATIHEKFTTDNVLGLCEQLRPKNLVFGMGGRRRTVEPVDAPLLEFDTLEPVRKSRRVS